MKTNNRLREALKQAKEIARTIYSTSDKGSSHEGLAEKIVELANAALAAPATAENSSAVGNAAKSRGALIAMLDEAIACPTVISGVWRP